MNKQNIDNDIILFINTLFTKQIFNDKIMPRLGINEKEKNKDMEIKKVKILLYAFRYIFSIIINQKNNINNNNLFYNNLLTKNISSIIENNFIPGNFRQIGQDNDYNKKGIKLIDKELFLKNKENDIKEPKDITYRLLNLILYSFLFYSNIQEFIKDKYLSKNIINSMTCFEIIEANWDFIEKFFENDKIEEILNIIFDSIKEKLITAELFKTKNDVDQFENAINSIIIEKINNKNELIKKYKEINNIFINSIPYNNKAIIQEKYSSGFYSDEEYPNLKYFYISEFPSKEDFESKFNKLNKKEEKYPILYTIICNKPFVEKIDLLKNIPTINKVCNFMINYCSFRFSRDEAKKIKIDNKDKFEEIFEYLSNFQDIYKKIVLYIKKENHNEIDKEFDILNDELVLSHLCVDSGDKNFGAVLLLIYKKMSQWQNKFIDFVVNSKNDDLQKYKELFEYKIMIQDCKEDHLINLPKLENDYIIKKKDKNDDNINLMELIRNNSYRKDNKIFYNYEEIEEQLGSNILPKIKSFKNEFRTVIYQYETYIGKRSGIITNFINKYKQRKLSEKELKLVINYIYSNNNNLDIKNFLFSLQILIDNILENNYEINKTIISILENFEEDIPGGEIIKNFYNSFRENMDNDNNIDDNLENLFTIDSIIDLMDIIQLFCWDHIRNNLDNKYLKDIDDNIKEKINKHFDKNNIEKNNYKITKIDLCSAIRIYISRYLLGKNDGNINPQNDLYIYLKNIELWEFNYDLKIIDNEIDQIFKDIKVEISQALKLYDYLGGDKHKLDEIKKKYKVNHNEINDNQNDNLIIKIQKKKKKKNDEEEEEEEEEKELEQNEENEENEEEDKEKEEVEEEEEIKDINDII